METITTKEFKNNMKKYLDGALKEKVIIVRDKDIFILSKFESPKVGDTKAGNLGATNSLGTPKSGDTGSLGTPVGATKVDAVFTKEIPMPTKGGSLAYGGYDRCEDQPFDPEKGIFRKDIYGRTFVPVQWMDRDESGKRIPVEKLKEIVKGKHLVGKY